MISNITDRTNQLVQRGYILFGQHEVLRILIVGAGILGLAVAYIYPNPYTKVIPIALLIGVVAERFAHPEESAFSGTRSPRIVASAILVGIMVGNLIYIQNTFWRPLELFVLTAVLYGLCGILAASAPRWAVLSALLVGFQQRLMIYYSSAVQIGYDSLFHQRMAAEIATTGTLTPLAEATSKYYYAAVYHLLVAIGMDLTNVPVRVAGFLTASVGVTVIPPLLVYAMANRYWSSQAGALGAILFISADYSVTWGFRPRPLVIAAMLFPVLFFSLISYFEHGDRRFYLLAMGSYSAMLFVHQFSTFTSLVGLTAVSCVYYASRAPQAKRALVTVFTAGLLLFVDWTVTLYRGPLGDAPSFFTTLVGLFTRKVAEFSGNRQVIYPGSEFYVVSGGNSLDPVQIVGIGSLFTLSVAGVLYARRRDRTPSEFALGCVTTIGAMAGFAFAGPLVGLSVLQPFRWFVFLYVPATVLGGIYLSSISISHNKLASVIIVGLLVASFGFLAGANFTAAPDGAPLDSPGAERLSIHEDEAAAMSFVAERSGQSTIIADFVAWQLINRHFDGNAKLYQYYEYGGPIVHDGEKLILYRPYMSTHHAAWQIQLGKSIWRVHGPIPKPDGSRVYHSGRGELLHSDRDR